MNDLLSKYKNVFQLIHTQRPGLLLYAFFFSLMNVALPYLILLMTTVALNGLLAGNTFLQLTFKILLLGGIILICQIAQKFFEKKRDDAYDEFNLNLEKATTLKLLTISYFQLQDPQMRAAYQKAKEGTNYSGGFNQFIRSVLEDLLNAVIALIVGVGAVTALLSAKEHQALPQPWEFFVNDWGFVLVIFFCVVTPIFCNLILAKKKNELEKGMFDFFTFVNRQSNYIFNVIFDYQNGPALRMYNGNQLMFHEMVKQNDLFLERSLKEDHKRSNLTDGGSALISLLLIPIFLLVAMKGYVGAIAIGSIFLYTGYFTQLVATLNTAFMALPKGNMLLGFLDFYFDFLALDPQENGSLPVEKRNDNEYEIEFHHVSFKYPGSEEYVLKDLNLKLTIGQRTAIVGRNGSGKTTFIKLLCRLYPVTQGRITLNGIEIDKYDLKEYQDILAVVFQDFKLFAFSVAENVAANRHFDTKRVTDALYIAGVKERVATMPVGIDSILYKDLNDQGVEISGGEAQKIAIARAWYKDAPFVILDEPTSALDPFSEYEIYRRFDDLVQDKTSIYISHRMSSARFSDRIVVFEGGRVQQDANHETLIQQPGLYQELFNAQAQYYVEDLTDEQLATLFS